MRRPAPLQHDLSSQPTTFEDKKGESGKLTNILAQKSGWPFRGKDRNTETRSLFRTRRWVPLNLPFPVQGEQVLFQSQEKILCFPRSQGRIDFQTIRRRP